MPVAYQIPPWVGQPAEPSANYAQGFQIGVRLGAEQAANQYRQQQILLEQQKMAFENQYAQQKQALEVADVIQKQRAIASYQGMINQGVDPMRALQFVGPSLGVDPSRIAAIEESRMDREAQRQATQQHWASQMALGRQREARIETQGEKRLSLAEQRIADAEAKAAKADSDRQAALQLRKETESDKAERSKQALSIRIANDPQVRLIDQRLSSARQALTSKTAGNMFPLGSKEKYQKAIDDLEDQRKARVNQLLGQERALEPPEVVGNNTMPDLPKPGTASKRLKWTGTRFAPVQ